MNSQRYLKYLTATLLATGGVNWGLVGLFDFDLVAKLFGGNRSTASRIIYSLVALSAIHQAFMYPRDQRVFNTLQQEPIKTAA